MKIVNRKKFTTRILELITILGTIILTPISINYANSFRGYQSYGGEYLVPVLGLIVILIIETLYEESEKKKGDKKNGRR